MQFTNIIIMRPFHLAFPVTDLKSTKSFYVDILKCEVGRSSNEWIDFNMFGHQVVAHLVDKNNHPASNSVDGDEVPASHFGVVLTMSQWKDLKNHLLEQKIQFIIEPKIRLKVKQVSRLQCFLKTLLEMRLNLRHLMTIIRSLQSKEIKSNG